ncbi:MAG TPA: trypsin-like peptidase domain-containing protein [Vicinamibacterales bacterium]|nr:trypsin-like peptidase domain-containing protein [Vicinamibacterales bacterium]
MSTRKTTLFYAILIAIASAAVGMVIASQWGLSPPSAAQSMNVPAGNSAPLSGPIDAQTFRNIARAQSPTVVNITTQARARGREMTEFFGGDDFLRRFFGQSQPRPGRPRTEEPPTQQGTGTGFIIDKSGLILTNNHVVEGADDIRVSLFGGGRTESYTAKVIGRDVLTDSALIQLTEMPKAALQEVKFGDSDQMQPGDWVMAIGNPFNLNHTVTVGVISALGRPFGVAQREQPMLQTDAAINPGNSGGPLLNIRGEVVGINTSIFTDQRSANIGIGFATPINTVRDLLPQLRTGKVVRGVIGIQVSRDPLTADVAEAMGLPDTNGAIVSGVTENQPAAKAGMQPGDVIVEFNGRQVKDSDALVALVVATKPGTSVPVTVYRAKQRKALNVTVDELDLEAEANRGARARPDGTDEPTTTGLGMTIEPITPDVARELEVPRNRGGAVVTDVQRNSPAFYAGIAPGDVILEVNRTPVTSPGQVQRELQRAEDGTPAFLLLWRNGAETFVTVRKR